jgi:hypothetical protein
VEGKFSSSSSSSSSSCPSSSPPLLLFFLLLCSFSLIVPLLRVIYTQVNLWGRSLQTNPDGALVASRSGSGFDLIRNVKDTLDMATFLGRRAPAVGTNCSFDEAIEKASLALNASFNTAILQRKRSLNGLSGGLSGASTDPPSLCDGRWNLAEQLLGADRYLGWAESAGPDQPFPTPRPTLETTDDASPPRAQLLGADTVGRLIGVLCGAEPSILKPAANRRCK